MPNKGGRLGEATGCRVFGGRLAKLQEFIGESNNKKY